MNKMRAVSVVVSVLLAAGILAGGCVSMDRSRGLKPGDICSLGLDVQRNEEASAVKLMTIYGREVSKPPSLFSQGNYGQRLPRLRLAVVPPKGVAINGTGLNSGFGEDWSVVRETLSWGALANPSDLNSGVQKTLTYEYDGRRGELRIAGERFPLAEGWGFIVVMDEDWSPRVYRKDAAPYSSPVLKKHEEELQQFFK